MKINIKKLSDTATIPTRADVGSAGWDLYADIPSGEITIENETVFINTGIAIEIPEGYWGAIYARSGLACKQGLRPANCVGVIDPSYRDSIKVALHNDNPGIVIGYLHNSNRLVSGEIPMINYDAYKIIRHGDRIAQLIIHKCEDIDFCEVDNLSETERGTGGFGSRGR